jgi:hypothetical protein
LGTFLSGIVAHALKGFKIVSAVFTFILIRWHVQAASWRRI